MDGRDFGPPRSVHVPPPLLAGLTMEPHRLGAAAAAGRVPPSPGHLGANHPPSLHSGKFLPTAINIHPHHSDAFPAGSTPFLSGYPGPSSLTPDPAYRSSNPSGLQMAQLWASHAHEGYPPLPSSLYSSHYLSLGHLEPPSLSQHPLYDSHKDAYFLPPHLSQSPLHTPAVSSSTSSSSAPSQRTSRDGGRDRSYRAERERERSREESRPHSVVDLTQDGRGDEDRKASRDQEREKDKDRDSDRDGWSFHPHQHKSHSQPSTVESRYRPSPPQPSFPADGSASRLHGPETDRGGRDEGRSRSHHNSNLNNSNPDQERRNESVATPVGSLHISYVLPPALHPSTPGPPTLSEPREFIREQRVSAPTYVPSVEVYEERAGPIQIASQARDNKHADKHRELERDRDRESSRFQEKHLRERARLSQCSDVNNQREEGSIICSFGKRVQDPTSQSQLSPETRDGYKHSNRTGPERTGAEPKWNAISPLANYATNHIAALAAQHTLSSPRSQTHSQKSSSPHTSHRPASSQSSHSHSPQSQPSQQASGCTDEEGCHQRRYLTPSSLYRGSSNKGADSAEVSAMQSLIKYSGNFAADSPASSRPVTDGRGAFGGLACIGTDALREKERDREKASVGSGSLGGMRVPSQLKREQERPDSARSFGREGEGEVRHPPVGIAVAVARQRDSGSSSKQSSGTSEPQRPLLQTAIKDEERAGERARHHDDRLLAGRLEREKVIRESKNLQEFTQMHPGPLSGRLTPSMMTPSLMTPNLMVTGGAALAGTRRWPSDPSTLTSHPWMPRPGAPPVWLSSSPYGLSPSSIHPSLPPGYPPSLPGSMPPPYQFARDPQSGQLIVIPTEHLPHYGGDALERGAPVWPGVYGAGSPLQHAAQLQLLSQQQMLRQHELLMIQQHTVQVLELQRNVQLAERLKASERQGQEDKADKRNSDPKTRPSSVPSPSPSPVLHPRSKPAPPSRSPTPSTSSITPLPRISSPAATLKSEEGGHRALSHTPKSLLHPNSPRSASPPPSSPRQPKRELVEVGQREQRELPKSASAAFPGIYAEIPPGYPYQSITAPYGSPFPYHIPPPAGGIPEERCSCSPASADALPPPHCRSRLLEADIKPQKLELSTAGPFLKQESCAGRPRGGPSPELLSPPQSLNPVQTSQDAEDRPAPKLHPQPLPLHARSPPLLQNEELENDLAEDEDGVSVKMEASSYSCRGAYDAPPLLVEAVPRPEISEELDRAPYPPTITAESDERQRQPNATVGRFSPRLTETVSEPSEPTPPILSSEDPMGGMLVLLTASEMARPSTPPAPTLVSQLELQSLDLLDPACSRTGPLEMVALEGMALLSQMAQQEMENICQEKDLTFEGLDCLIEASRQILLEAIEQQSHIDLPRNLDPNKKYSWRQRKEEPLYDKMSVDMLDAVEVEYRARLAELQKTYKEKQRELNKLQRRTDKREQLQQEDERRSLTRRGRGRPRKRKLLAHKLDSRTAKTGRIVQYSEESETGEGQRKRFRLSRDEEDMELTEAKVKKKKKKKKKIWADQEPSSSHSLEVLKTRRGLVCEQEQLASDLDRALSLSQLGSLGGTSRKLTSNTKSEKLKSKSAGGALKERFHSTGVAGKLKAATKASETVRRLKDSDSEEHGSARGGWPPLSGTRSHGSLTRKRRSVSPLTSLLSSRKSEKKKHKHLSLLLEEAGLSSSDDSFDQGY